MFETGSRPIKYVVQPELSPQRVGDTIVPNVGNALVYPMIGDFDRPMITQANGPAPQFTLPMKPGFLGQASGANAAQIGIGSELRTGFGNRNLPTENNTASNPSYMFGDVSVDPSIVQNAGQFEIPTAIGRDLVFRNTSLNAGGNIIWPLGERHGTSTRVMQRNVANLCK
jgi:hypothetical protein